MAGLLPSLVLMTDDARLPDPLAAAAALPKGAMVIVRARDAERRAALAADILVLARRRDLFVLIADDPAIAAQLGADGVHLPERRAREAGHWRALHPRWIISAAAHTPSAMHASADLILLSAVFPTRSHPDGATWGAARANALARASPVPIYALGGIDARNAMLLNGFAGIAAIGALAV
jgi:thiamine-phosphate pyrophosphorylase